MDIKTKRCLICGQIKQCTEFYNNSGAKDGLSGLCKECDKKRMSERKRYRTGHNSQKEILIYLASHLKEIQDNGNAILSKTIEKALKFHWNTVSFGLENLGLVKDSDYTLQGKKFGLNIERLKKLIDKKNTEVEEENENKIPQISTIPKSEQLESEIELLEGRIAELEEKIKLSELSKRKELLEMHMLKLEEQMRKTELEDTEVKRGIM